MDSNSNLDSNFFESPMKYVEWKIRNFFDLPTQDNYEMRSPQFSLSGTNWYLRVHPNGHIGNKSLNWISMYLVKKYSSVKYFVNFKMGIRKADGSILKNIDLTYEFPMASKRYGEAEFIERSFLELSDGALDKNGTLTVFCTVQIENQSPRLRYLKTASQTSIIPTLEAESQTSIVSTLEAESQTSIVSTLEAESQTSIISTLEAESQTSIISALEAESKTLESFNVNSACWPPTDVLVSPESKRGNYPNRGRYNYTNWGRYNYTNRGRRNFINRFRNRTDSGILTLTDNFKELYLSKRYADVRITVKGRDFFAHKVVLTCRSPVFSSMFNSDMAENETGKIEITDCEPDSFDEFLLFLYTGKVDMVTSSNAVSLYETADKYDVQELKNECLLCMMQELTTESFCDVVRLATLHEERDLLQKTIDFFIENAKSILVTSKWQNLNAEYPVLANELFLKFVQKYA